MEASLVDGVNNKNQLDTETPNNITIKGILGLLMANTETTLISLGMGDPTAYSCFHSPVIAHDAVVETLASHKFNGYCPTVGLLQTRKAIADYLSRDLPDKLCADDVYVTAGCTQAIETALSILARPGANILLPRPGFPIYALCFFGAIAPVLTLGSLSKRWLVPGWRLGWLITNDPNGTFKNPKFVERIKKYCDICGAPATFIQAAVPRIIQQTEDVFFRKTVNLLKCTADICCEKIKEIPCISCLHKPDGSMAVMVKLNLSLLTDIRDYIDFCFKLAKEESVIRTNLQIKRSAILITFAVDPSSLEEALGRLKSFRQTHSCQQNGHL
ncbi:unnamed protein product [Withania somnifera]